MLPYGTGICHNLPLCFYIAFLFIVSFHSFVDNNNNSGINKSDESPRYQHVLDLFATRVAEFTAWRENFVFYFPCKSSQVS